jgi:hypothetical protein
MTNQAPPDLVRDALQAAMDEWNHATTSFSIVNHRHHQEGSSGDKAMAGSPVDGMMMFHEPSALPPTKHGFESNLMALAK